MEDQATQRVPDPVFRTGRGDGARGNEGDEGVWEEEVAGGHEGGLVRGRRRGRQGEGRLVADRDGFRRDSDVYEETDQLSLRIRVCDTRSRVLY